MEKVKTILKDTLWIILGSGLYSFGLQSFAVPNELILGGAGGAATIFYHLWQLPIGLGAAIINLPLLIIAFFALGRHSLWRTTYATLLFTAVLSAGEWIFTYRFEGDLVISALFGGLIMGLGLAAVYNRDYITGGSDLAAQILALKVPLLPFSKWVMLLDGIVVLGGALVFQSVEIGLYSVLMIFVYTLVFDSFLEGRSKGKMALIITDRPDEVTRVIDQMLERGCTRVQGQGSYSGQDKTVLMCALTDRQAAVLRSGILGCDPSAFVVVLRATEIWGEGFFKL